MPGIGKDARRRVLVGVLTGLTLLALVAVPQAAFAADTEHLNAVAQEEPPPDTTPPETEPPPSESDFDPVLLLLVILGVIILLVIIGAISSSNDRRAARQQAITDDWKARARGSYGKAKWLSENMSAEMAPRLGDIRHKRDDLMLDLTMDDEAVLDRWHQIERSVQEATSELYALEASPPVTAWAGIVHAAALDLQVVYSRIEEGAKAHRAYRNAEGNPELDTASALDVKLTFEHAIRDATATLAASLEEMRQIV